MSRPAEVASKLQQEMNDVGVHYAKVLSEAGVSRATFWRWLQDHFLLHECVNRNIIELCQSFVILKLSIFLFRSPLKLSKKADIL